MASFGIAMTGIDLETVFGFIGSTSSPAVMFILPGIFYYFMERKQSEEFCDFQSFHGVPGATESKSAVSQKRKGCLVKVNICGSVVTVGLGILLMIVSLTVFFLDLKY